MNLQVGDVELSEDTMLVLFGKLDFVYILTVLTLVCKHWNELISQKEALFVRFCELYLPPFCMKKNQYVAAWKDWFRIAVQSKFDPSFGVSSDPNNNHLNYSDDNYVVRKLHRSPDTNVALVARKIVEGKAYCEFFINNKGDELLVGVTDCPKVVAATRGWDLIQHPRTWAWWDRRVGIQLAGAARNATSYSTGDKVGILVDMDTRGVSFYLNGKLILKNPDSSSIKYGSGQIGLLPCIPTKEQLLIELNRRIEASILAADSEEVATYEKALYNYEIIDPSKHNLYPSVSLQFFVMLDFADDVVSVSDFY